MTTKINYKNLRSNDLILLTQSIDRSRGYVYRVKSVTLPFIHVERWNGYSREWEFSPALSINEHSFLRVSKKAIA